MIQIYKNIDGLNEVQFSLFRLIKDLNFVVSDYFTRRKCLQLRGELAKNCSPKFSFLTNRVVENLYALSDEIIRARSLKSFKAKIDGYLKCSS